MPSTYSSARSSAAEGINSVGTATAGTTQEAEDWRLRSHWAARTHWKLRQAPPPKTNSRAAAEWQAKHKPSFISDRCEACPVCLRHGLLAVRTKGRKESPTIHLWWGHCTEIKKSLHLEKNVQFIGVSQKARTDQSDGVLSSTCRSSSGTEQLFDFMSCDQIDSLSAVKHQFNKFYF